MQDFFFGFCFRLRFSTSFVALPFFAPFSRMTSARISICIPLGQRGSGVCCLNGAAARACHLPDDLPNVVSPRRVECASIACYGFAMSPRVLMFRHDRRPNKPLKCSSTAQTLKARSRFSTWSPSPRNVIRLPPSAPLQGRSRRLRARSGRQGMFRHEDLDERNTGRGHRNMPALVLLRSFATARFSNCRLPSAERLPGAATPAGFGASR